MARIVKTSRLVQVKEVFMAALARDAEDREAFVERACGSSPEVRREVLRLVRVRRDLSNGLRGRPKSDARSETPVAPPPNADLPKTGERVLARYVLGEIIGAGAFGTVYRAVDDITKTPVAVKVTALRTARAAQWHRLEVASLLRSHLPGVVRLLATGQVGDHAVLVMDLVEGTAFPGDGVSEEDVDAILARGASLLEAVARLHAAGVFHRDLKPANVLVGADGRVTLVDLGIAQDESDTTRRSEGMLAGTPAYMAPELLRGGAAGRRTEVYAVGVVLVHALTGEVPELVRPRHPRPDPLEAYPEEVRDRLEELLSEPVRELVVSMVHEDPGRRPRDAEEALRRLEEQIGPRRAIELPDLGGRDALDAVLGAARAGRAIDVAGPFGSGRSRLLREAEKELGVEGFLVRRLRPAPAADAGSVPFPGEDGAAEIEDRALCGRLRRQLTDGMVLLVDDADTLDTPTRDLVAELRAYGAVIRATAHADGDAVRLEPLTREDLAPLVRGPERIFHLVSEVSELLRHRSRGWPREVAREIRSWCALGLAEWRDGLIVAPAALRRLRSLGATPAGIADFPPDLPAGTREVWDTLTLVAAPLDADGVAAVLDRPARVVRSELRALVESGFVTLGEDDALILVRSSPFLADVDPEVRARWSRRAAPLLASRSETRVRHLLLAGEYEAACAESLETARRQLAEGRTAAATTTLDAALATCRQHLPRRPDLYGDLLGVMVEAALGTTTPEAIALARYHANLAPARTERVAAWDVILQAEAAMLNGDAAGALAILDEGRSPPTEAHERSAHIIACYAARATGSQETTKQRILNAAPWARRIGNPDSRALLAAWTGWLRFEQGRFAAARGLHHRSARLTRRARARVTSLVNAAMAAVEDLNLEVARQAAADALDAARVIRDGVNEARAELLLRQIEYRMEVASEVDSDLVEAARHLGDPGTRGVLRLNEAAIAWRSRRLARAHGLAVSSATDLRSAGFRVAAGLALALAANGGRPLPSEALNEIAEIARIGHPIGIVAQALALVERPGRDRGIAPAVAASLAWAREASGANIRREVLTPREVLGRLGEHDTAVRT